MKETLKDKYIKVLNNTIDVGNCSKCGSSDLECDKYSLFVDGEDVFRDYTCNDCKSKTSYIFKVTKLFTQPHFESTRLYLK